MNKTKTRLLTESGVMIALAAILSLIKVFALPYGGSVTLCSMLPIILVGYRNGVRWGVLTAFAYSIIQLILDIPSGIFRGVSLGMVVGVVVFDYLIAFTALGLGGLFKNKIKNAPLSLVCGALVAMIVRYLAHAVSGYIFFSEYAEWFFGQEGFAFGQQMLEKYHGNTLFVIYTLFYNGTFMIPEIIITSIVCVLVVSVLKLVDKKQITQ